jgi:signal transduction histidine kinase/ActR/RegA family two-component response regulator
MTQTRFAPIVTFFAVILTAAAVVLPPAIYLVLSYSHEAGSIEAEAEINARIVGRIIAMNPDLWHFEELRLSEILARRPRSGTAEQRSVLDAGGRVVAASGDPLPPPLIRRSVPLLDAGMPVGSLEIARSLRPLLLRVGTLSLALLVVGVLSFGAVRTVPLRLIRRSEETQRQLQEQLRHAEKLEAIGQLASGIAHDFNNVLSVIKGYGVLLRRRLPGDGPERRYADEIIASTDRATSLTRGLLSFGGRQVLSPEPVDLVEVVQASERVLRRLAGDGVELRTELSRTPLPVMVDPLQIERVLMNLVANARDAMPAGGRVVISASRTDLDARGAAEAGLDTPGPHARISVSDTGPGIDPKVRRRIFEPFFTTKGGLGTGLGLSIVHGIVRQHRGAIRAGGEVGRGATFTFLLPLIGEAAPLSRREELAASPGGTETVLVADDDVAVRGTLRQVLEGAGYAVVEAVDGRDAVRRFEEQRGRIRLVLLDATMPGQDGRLTLHQIRSIEPATRAVFLSRNSDSQSSARPLDRADDVVLPKPAHPVALLRAIRTALDAGDRPADGDESRPASS